LRRILTVLTAAALMAAMLVVLQGPAMAQSIFDFDNNDNDNFDNNDIFDNNDNFDNNDIFRDNGLDNSFDIEQETDQTGDVTLDTSIVNTGNNSNQCVAPLQFGNTGNLQNAQGFLQTGSTSNNDSFRNNDNNDLFGNNFFDFNDRNDLFRNNDGGNSVDDVDFEGASMTFNPEQNVECNQQVQQSAAASG
jgi:hypothetical protein